MIYEASSPGRVCMVGEHCDYARGKCIALPTSQKVKAKGCKRADELIKIKSVLDGDELNLGFVLGDDFLDLSHPLSYCRAVIQAVLQKGFVLGGAEIDIESDLPIGKGLSSSAAVTVTTAKILNEIFSLGLGSAEIAELAYIAEHDILGIGCGRMDQLASAHDSFLMLDFSQGTKPHVKRLSKPAVELHLLVGIPTKTKRDIKNILTHCNQAYFSPAEKKHFDFKIVLDEYIPEKVIRPMEKEIKNGNIEGIGRMLRLNQEIYDKFFLPVCDEFDAPYLYQCLKIARENGSVGEKWTGAGGAGSFLCLARSERDLNRLKQALKEGTN